MAEVLLKVEELSVEYVGPAGPQRVVDGVSLTVHEGEILGLCGESGSGKSTLVHAIMRTLGSPGLVTGGRVLYRGTDVLDLSEGELRELRFAMC